MKLYKLNGDVIGTGDTAREICEANKHNLSRSDLSESDLSGSNLSGSNLSESDLSRSDLSGSNLRWSNLRWSNLRWSNLSESDLSWSDLSGSNLSGSNLTESNLSRSNLSRSNLSGAIYSLIAVLRANWYALPDDLTLELMRWDAIACGADAMTAWAKGGRSPFTNKEREFYFKEKRELWRPGKPKMNMLELWRALAEEKKIKHSR
jgi:hypothetical protein